jgi:16S rRNA processing protein RimM
MTDEPGAAGLPSHLIVGHVSKAHGTKGELFIWPLTDAPLELFVEGRELIVGSVDGTPDPEAGTLLVERSRPFKRGVLVKFATLDDRNDVDAYAGRYLLSPLSDLRPLEEGEVFYHQLLGLKVETVDGEQVGRVREVYETEPAHMLEVRAEDGRTHLIPMAERIVRKLDVEGGRIVIKPPPGLLEL